jgi:hypothetical protein
MLIDAEEELEEEVVVVVTVAIYPCLFRSH